MKCWKTLTLAALSLCAACDAEQLEGRQSRAAPELATVVVDSVAPIAEALDRFRSDLAPVQHLRGGAPSKAAILREIGALISAADTAGFERITIDRAEYAYLYYPFAPLAHAPYELPPELAWFRLQQENRTAVRRLLRELGGSEVQTAELACAQPPNQQDENRIHAACVVRVSGREIRLFGSLLERDGVLKVLSWTNDF